MRKKLSSLFLVLVALSLLLTACGPTSSNSGSNGDTSDPNSQVLRIRKRAALVSTDWEVVTDTADP